ncbi:Phosphatidate phosphatase LPIN3 [Pitangus sulphuratus]|nr:Phosphatidate phosphatase LPIN3 [Pitangus sulphuratus]
MVERSCLHSGSEQLEDVSGQGDEQEAGKAFLPRVLANENQELYNLGVQPCESSVAELSRCPPGSTAPLLGLPGKMSQTMNYVGQLAGSVFVTVKELYQDLNPATLTGCIDVVVVRQPDNSFKCSPFHVRFGKLGVLRSREKVVDIEINGEPVDLHMKLGDNGEAFFVQESEENEDSIPFCLCTSPIPTEQSLKDSAQLSHGQEATGAQVTQHRRRRRRRKAKRKEVLGSESESCDETKGKMPMEEPCRLPAPGGAGCSSLADALEEEALSLQSPGVHPHSDGELASVDSFMLSHLSSPKSDSELEIRSQDSFAPGTESHMQWTWGRLPQVNKLERVEPAKSTKTIATARTSISATLVPVDEANPLAATSESLEGDPSPAGPQDIPRSSAVSVIETTLAPQDGNSIPSAEGAESLLGASSVPQEKQEEDGSVVPEVQPAVEPFEEATARRQAGSEGPEHQLERQRSQEKFMEHMVSYQQFAENPRLVNDPNLVILINNKYYNWAVAAPMVLSLQAFHRSIPESIIDDLVKEKMPKKGRRWWFWRRREFPAEEKQPKPGKANEGMLQPDSAQQRQEEEGSSSDDETLHSRDMLAIEAPAQKPLPTYKKSLRLSSEQIERLNLQDGPNEVAFSVTTQYQGTCRCEATIYLWNWDDKVVISDIDGTITKSDALGHILPHLGKDWTHHGIVKLFHKIHLNGYKFLYCSARAIGMAHITKGYLKWVNEQGCALPRGPILLAPSSLFSAFHREVIEKKPEVFKIACLRDIQNLFATKCPFHAAFGNRPNDVYAYKQVGLPESRIFTVNPRGELMQELTKNNKSTYERLSELVELIFPPLEQSGRAGLACPEYSHFSYWRPPLPDVDLDAAF